MLQIPYVGSPKNACALACYTMTAKYFFPETTFDQVAQIVDWQPGKVAWAYRFWWWLLEQGIKVTDYDLINLESWASQGVAGLKASVSAKEFEYYQKHSGDLTALTADIQKVASHPNFSYHRQKPTLEQLRQAVDEGKVCEVVLDSHTLDRVEGFALHRVVVLSVTEDQVTFHDPRPEPRAGRTEPLEHFTKAWLTAVAEPELCVYNQITLRSSVRG